MKAFRFLRALPLAVLLFSAPLRAEQGTIVGPTSGPHTMTDVMGVVNSALLAIQSCNSGTSAPANGVGGTPTHYQCWADTSNAPTISYKVYDGNSWVQIGTLDASAHLWTPKRRGGALTILGRATNSAGDIADITAAGGSSCAFRESSNTIACGQLATDAYANSSVSNAKLAQMANGSTKCRTTAGTGDPEDCTASQMQSLLSLVPSTNVQVWDADLDCIAAISSTGIISRTGAGACAPRAITGPVAGISVANGDGVSGNPALALTNDLAALEGLSGTGCAARVGVDAWALRSITGTTNEISVSNGDCVAGNPVVSLPSALTFTGKTVTGGAFTGAAWDNGAIGGTTPAAGAFTTLQATQTVKWTGVISPSITADQNDWAPSGFSTATVLRVTTDAGRNATGLAGGADGRLITIHNIGVNDLILKNESGSSSAANRFAIGSDTTIAAGTSSTLRYDGTSSRWRAIAGAGSGGGGGTGTVTSITAGSGLSGGTITSSGTVSLDINGLSTDSAPDIAADYVATYDASAAANKKVLAKNLGARVLLNTLTASSSASLDDTTSFSSTFNTYEIVLEDIVPNTSGLDLRIQVRSGGTFQTTSYLGTVFGINTAGPSTSTQGSTVSIPLTVVGGNYSGRLSGTIRVSSPLGTAGPKMWYGQTTSPNSANNNIMVNTVGGYWNSSSALDGFRLILSSGPISSGVMKVYGLR